MGVYIKGMEMPKTCYECPCQYDLISCQALNFESICEEGFDCTAQRLPNCPIVEVKTPKVTEAEKTGEWIDNETSYADGVKQTCTCSVCGIRSARPLGDYCKWCGARMIDEVEEC